MTPEQHINLITKADAITAELHTNMINAVSANVETPTEHNLLMATVLVMATANATQLLDIAIAPGNAVMVAKMKGILRAVELGETRTPVGEALARLIYLVEQLGG